MDLLKKLAERNNNPGECKPVVIAFIGDSVTHGAFEITLDRHGQMGVTYDTPDAYPNLLKQELDRMYPAAAVSIINAGVAGERSVDGAARFERDILSFHPDLVVIAFALNDSVNQDIDAGLGDYRTAMSSMLSQAEKENIPCIVLTPNFMCTYTASEIEDSPLRVTAELTAKMQNHGILALYVQAARDVAAEHNTPVADAYKYWETMAACGTDTTLLLANHINHPTREAHNIFSKVLMDTIFESCIEKDALTSLYIDERPVFTDDYSDITDLMGKFGSLMNLEPSDIEVQSLVKELEELFMNKYGFCNADILRSVAPAPDSATVSRESLAYSSFIYEAVEYYIKTTLAK